jgi:hypothetical protein
MKGRRDMLIEIDFDKSGKNCWKVFNKHTYKQSDGINCGPIWCMNIIDIYGLIKPGTIVEIGNQNGDYHSVVIDYYSNSIERFNSILRFELRALNKAKEGKKNDSKIPPPVSNRRSSPRNKSAVAKQLMNDSPVEKQLKNDSKLHPKKNSPVAKKISGVFEKEGRVGNMTWSIH